MLISIINVTIKMKNIKNITAAEPNKTITTIIN
jgi:hypothetical protein